MLIPYIFVFSLLISCFSPYIVWCRLYFLVDLLAHASLFGLSIAYFFSLSPFFCVFLSSFLLLLFSFLARDSFVDGKHSGRLILSSYALLAVAILLLCMRSDSDASLLSAFSGDLLLVEKEDVYKCLLCSPCFVIILAQKKAFLRVALNEELARSEGVPVNFLKAVLALCLALFLSCSFQSLGALLSPALMILPALSASKIAKTPEQMIVGTCVLSLLVFSIGVYIARIIDINASPLIILCCVFFYFICCVLCFFRNE